MSDPDTDTISLYDTPYNKLCTYHHTPTLEDLENPTAIPCQTEIAPITFTATGIRLITAYTVPRTPSRQSDILLFSTDTPKPILRTFRSSTPLDTHTYAIIYNGMQHILDTHAHDAEAKSNCIDIDPDNGEEEFYKTAHFYDRLTRNIRTYQEENNILSLRELFTASPEIHATIDYARMLDINYLEFPNTDLTYNTVRTQLNRYAIVTLR